jgi:hypothetical protein
MQAARSGGDLNTKGQGSHSVKAVIALQGKCCLRQVAHTEHKSGNIVHQRLPPPQDSFSFTRSELIVLPSISRMSN